MDPDLKTGVSRILKIQQLESHSIGLRVSFPELLFNYNMLSVSEKSPLSKVFSPHIPAHYRLC